MDRNRNPDPSFQGEVAVIQQCLQQAGWSPRDVDYINPHGTGAPLGDETELRAIRHCELTGAHLNATKSIIGHGLSAAGTVELIAILLQMKAGQLHPTRNLDDPIDPDRAWVRDHAIAHVTQRALNLSMGFGGINTAVGVQRL
jgi:malonyl-ACP decarboxylase